MEICFTGGNIKQMKNWLGDSLTYVEQEKGDLGFRMFSALKRSINEGANKVVVIGTDIPGQISHHIENAFYTLDEKDIVIGPATDGGYWLIGMKKPYDIFQGISWGKETVLQQTLKLVEETQTPEGWLINQEWVQMKQLSLPPPTMTAEDVLLLWVAMVVGKV